MIKKFVLIAVMCVCSYAQYTDRNVLYNIESDTTIENVALYADSTPTIFYMLKDAERVVFNGVVCSTNPPATGNGNIFVSTGHWHTATCLNAGVTNLNYLEFKNCKIADFSHFIHGLCPDTLIIDSCEIEITGSMEYPYIFNEGLDIKCRGTSHYIKITNNTFIADKKCDHVIYILGKNGKVFIDNNNFIVDSCNALVKLYSDIDAPYFWDTVSITNNDIYGLYEWPFTQLSGNGWCYYLEFTGNTDFASSYEWLIYGEWRYADDTVQTPKKMLINNFLNNLINKYCVE